MKQCSFQCIRLLGGMKEDEFLKYFVLDIFNQKFDYGTLGSRRGEL